MATAVSLVGYGLGASVLQFEGDTNSLALPRSAWVPLVYALLVPSALCYGLLSFANMHAPSSVVSAFWPFQVPVSLVASALCGFSTISGAQSLGGLCIVAGLLLVCYEAHRRQQDADADAVHDDYAVAADSDDDVDVDIDLT